MKSFPFRSFHLLEAACGPYEWLLELLIPKVSIPKIGRNSHHHVFCYSSESGNSVKRLKSDPGPDDKNQGGWQLSFRSSLIMHMTRSRAGVHRICE